MLIYKILRPMEWNDTEHNGAFSGSPDDRRDGFIHCSLAEQVRETYEKHFAGETGLVLAAIETDSLARSLKWEISRGGALFPHIYGQLPRAAIRWTRPIASVSDIGDLSP